MSNKKATVAQIKHDLRIIDREFLIDSIISLKTQYLYQEDSYKRSDRQINSFTPTFKVSSDENTEH